MVLGCSLLFPCYYNIQHSIALHTTSCTCAILFFKVKSIEFHFELDLDYRTCIYVIHVSYLYYKIVVFYNIVLCKLPLHIKVHIHVSLGLVGLVASQPRTGIVSCHN